MIKSKRQKVISIFDTNAQVQKLFDEFDVDFESTIGDVVDVLMSYDTLIQDETVFNLSENPEQIQGKPEITQIVCRADSGGDLAGTYFKIAAPNLQNYVWYNTGSTQSPLVPNAISIPVVILPNDSAADVASKTATAIDNEIYFNATASGDTITIVNNDNGSAADAENGPSFSSTGFEITVLQEGIASSMSIAALNEEVSTALGLFPISIGSPHEDFYRSFVSNDGTAYTYFLKWIYYNYKYFNEEQFFFNNLLEHFIPDYDSTIISSTTQLKIYFDGLGIILDTLDQKIEDLYNLGDPDTIDEKYLQHMAQLLGYQKEDFSIQNISFRQLIKNLTEIYRTKGTRYSFSLFFKLLGFNADLREYYWDRDAINPESFSSITSSNYLWYLTVQDPRTRTVTQTENPASSQPVQPIPTSEWVQPKDLRDFEGLQSEYSIDQLLGFKESDLPEEDRFTYFKTNFINFRLVQFYNKQDLTAKDTDTILKYVRFLTPIYVSSFVEVITTPWEDFFNLSNPLANELNISGDPGTPFWVDILLPFIFVSLKEYIPINLNPPPNEVVVIAQHAWSDLNSDGQSDSALSTMFGPPDHGIDLQGSIPISPDKDLSNNNNLMAIKVDRGRGKEVVIQGALTYSDLVSNINTYFNTNGINATATLSGSSPNIDIRITSNTSGTTSKIYIIDTEQKNLFAALSTTTEDPVDGQLGSSGYQEFGLNLTSGADATGLDVTQNYRFYINVNITDFVEVDVSGENPTSTTPIEVRDAINNNYDFGTPTAFIQTTPIGVISSAKLHNGKVVIFYKDNNSLNGRLVIMNPNGSIFRAGLNATLTNLDSAAIAASNDESVPRFIVIYHDTINLTTKWAVFDDIGNKITIDQQLEPSTVGVSNIKAITLSNNLIAVGYKTSTPDGGRLKTIDISGNPAVLNTCDWIDDPINEFDLATSGDNIIVAGSAPSPSRGFVVYIENDCSFLIDNDRASSTKIFTSRNIAEVNVEEVADPTSGDVAAFVTYRDNNSVLSNYEIYSTIYDDFGTITSGESIIVNEDAGIVSTTVGYNGNVVVVFEKQSDSALYYQVHYADKDLAKKQALLYNDTVFSEIDILTLDTGNLALTMAPPNRGTFTVLRSFGEIASITTNGELFLRSTNAGDAWDDSVGAYARATDQGHFYEIDGGSFETDNYYQYYSDLGIDFTTERNKWNTHFTTSPDDDLIALIEDALTLAISVLIGVQDTPVDRVDKAGFYPRRNNYISRNVYLLVEGNEPLAHYTRHQDISAPLKVDPQRSYKETQWPSWNRGNTTYEDWSSFVMALDRFEPSIDWPEFDPIGGITLQSTVPVQYGPFAIFPYSFPDDSTVYFLIEGNITDLDGTATLTFTTTGTFPVGSQIGFINEQGIFETVPTTQPFPDTLVAEVDHLSLWGISLSTEPAANVSVSVTGAETQAIKKFERVAPGGMTFGGVSQYGPFKEFTYAVITTALVATGNADTVSAEDIEAPTPTGGLTLTGDTDTDFTQTFAWTTTAPRRINLNGTVDIDDIVANYDPVGGMIASGTALVDAASETTGSGGAILSGDAEIEVNYIRPETAVVILMSGTADDAQVENIYEASGSATLTGDANVEVDRTVEVTTAAITLSGEIIGTLEFEYEATGDIALSGINVAEAEYTVEIIATAITTTGEAVTEIEILAAASGIIVLKGGANYQVDGDELVFAYNPTGVIYSSGVAEYLPEVVYIVETQTFREEINEFVTTPFFSTVFADTAVDLILDMRGSIYLSGSAEIAIDDGTTLIVEAQGSGKAIFTTNVSTENVIDITFTDQPAGGMTADGTAEPNTIDRTTADPTGGITSGGTADTTIEIARTATGGIDTLGVSSYQEVGL